MKNAIRLAAVLVGMGLTSVAALAATPSEKVPPNFVLVKGGAFTNVKSNYYGKGVTVSDFYIGKYLVTQREWTEVMGTNPSRFQGDDLPVERVNWYDSIEYCNKRSIREGLRPYYNIDMSKKDVNNKPDPTFGDLDDIKWTVTT